MNFESSLQKGHNKFRYCRWVPGFALGSLETKETFQSGPSPEQRAGEGGLSQIPASRGPERKEGLGKMEREFVRTYRRAWVGLR